MTVRKVGAKPYVFLKIRFGDILISSLSMGGSGGEDRLTTNVSMMPLEKITLTYWPQKADGSAGDPIEAKWALTAGQVRSFSGDPQAVSGLFLAGPSLTLEGLPLSPGVPIPEPQTWLMLGLGLAGLAGWQRRRQRVSATAALPA